MSETKTFVWNELVTSDLPAARAFYEGVVGWTVQSMDMPDGKTYHLFMEGDAYRGGLMSLDDIPGAGVPPHWMSYIGVDDVDATCAATERAGGKVLMQPFDVPGVGRMATLEDPQGAQFSVMKEAI